MSRVAKRLESLGLALPAPPAAVGDYVPAVRAGGFVFTSGQLPFREGVLVATGLVGEDVSPETAYECATIAALNALAAASMVCDLDDITAAVKLTGFVASVPGFVAQPGVINGSSAVLAAAFGDSGAHAREAVGVAALPLGAPVEVSIVLLLGSQT